MSNQQMFLEIACILRRNWSEEFLRRILNCALAYEKVLLEEEATV